MRPKLALAVVFTVACTLVFMPSWAIPPVSNPWSKVKTAAAGRAESIGKPTAGCVRGAEILKQDTPGTLLMRAERKRNAAHPRLIALLKEIGGQYVQAGQAPLFLGDLSQVRGGPTMSAHASHQTGLDADVWYTRPKKWNSKASLKDRLRTPVVNMVDAKTQKVNSHFGEDQVELLRRFAERPEVDRILVNYPIKRALCEKRELALKRNPQGSDYAWIRKIRPWFGHQFHFHVRILCASSDAACLSGADPIPPGEGCDTSLDWWWSDEAREEAQKNQHRQDHPVMPELPEGCKPVLSS